MHISLDSALGRQRRLNQVGESITQIAPGSSVAYSLRSLTGGDPKAVRVRRSSDDSEQDFTVSGINSGALVDHVNTSYAKYTSDFSAGDDGWGSLDDVTETGNIDGIGGLDDNLRLAIGSATSQHRAFKTGILPPNQKINFSARVFIPSTNSVVDSLGIRDASGSVIIAAGTTPTQDQWVTVTASNVTTTNPSGQLRVDLQDGGTNNFAGNGSDVIYLREITVTQVTSDGFVSKWYDQSGNSKDAVQATAGNQPKIVNAGSLVVDNGVAGLDFDGDDFLVASSVTGLGSVISMFTVSVRDSSGYVVSASNSSAANRYFAIQDAATSASVQARNTTDEVVTASVSGADRLNFALTARSTFTSVGVNGGSMSTTTDDYGDDFSGTDLDQVAIGILRTVSPTGHYDGRIREILVYDNDETTQRTALEANMNSYYSIF